MGVFDDKKFEQLDWMTQITETIESPLNELLSRLPERLELDPRILFDFLTSHYNLSAETAQAVKFLIENDARNNNTKHSLTYEEWDMIINCFKWEIPEDTVIDLAKGEFLRGGKIYLVKHKSTFSDDELAPTLGKEGIQRLREIDVAASNATSRVNEVLELLGNCEEAMKKRSGRKKMFAVRERLRQIFKNNEWRIRDATLANKLCDWINQYIQCGNLAAFTNFCKVKVMTHNNMPIYSIEEEV